MRNILILKPEESIMYFRNNAQTSHAMVGMNKNSEFVINSNDATNQVNDIVFSVGGVGTIDNLTTEPTEVMRINDAGVEVSGNITATSVNGDYTYFTKYKPATRIDLTPTGNNLEIYYNSDESLWIRFKYTVTAPSWVTYTIKTFSPVFQRYYYTANADIVANISYNISK